MVHLFASSFEPGQAFFRIWRRAAEEAMLQTCQAGTEKVGEFPPHQALLLSRSLCLSLHLNWSSEPPASEEARGQHSCHIGETTWRQWQPTALESPHPATRPVWGRVQPQTPTASGGHTQRQSRLSEPSQPVGPPHVTLQDSGGIKPVAFGVICHAMLGNLTGGEAGRVDVEALGGHTSRGEPVGHPFQLLFQFSGALGEAGSWVIS